MKWVKVGSSYRSSHRRYSVRKGVLRNFAIFTGKHLCRSLFFNKVAALACKTLFKKETLAQLFSSEFCETSKNTFFTERLYATASVVKLNWIFIYFYILIRYIL